MNNSELSARTNEVVADVVSRSDCIVVSTNPENGHIRARMPFSSLYAHPELAGIGGGRLTKDEKTHLNNAIRRTSGAPIYGIAVAAIKKDGEFKYYIVDGSNRREEMTCENPEEPVDVIIYAAWDSIQEAQDGRVLLNSSGKNFDEAQVLSMLDAGFSISRICDVTRIPNTTAQRYSVIRDFPKLRNMVSRRALSVSKAADLAGECGENAELAERLENFLTGVEEEAEGKALKYRQKIEKDSERAVTPEDREKMTAGHYLKKTKWDAVKSAIADDSCHCTADNKPSLDVKNAKTESSPVEVGSEDDWQKKAEIKGFNKKFEEWTVSDFKEVLTNWAWMKEMILMHYNKCKLLSGCSEIAFPSKSDFLEEESEAQPEDEE